MKGERLTAGGLALSAFLAGCGEIVPSPETTSVTPITSPTPEATRTPKPIPTITKTPTLTPTPTPDILATQKAQWINLENAERKDPIELIDAQITRILFAGGFYWVEANITGEEGLTLFQSDCIKDALEETGGLGRQIEPGIYEPGSQIDVIRGNVKLPSDAIGGIIEFAGIKTPFVDLTEIENNGKTYDCDVVTTDESASTSLKSAYEELRPVLEKVYPRIKQIGNIVGNLLDLAEQKSEP